MLQVPVEVLVQIANDTRDLQDHLQTTKNLRLTCKAFAAVSTKILYKTIIVLPDRNTHRNRKMIELVVSR